MTDPNEAATRLIKILVEEGERRERMGRDVITLEFVLKSLRMILDILSTLLNHGETECPTNL
jgi:hypothetical protein